MGCEGAVLQERDWDGWHQLLLLHRAQLALYFLRRLQVFPSQSASSTGADCAARLCTRVS
jgi:hypothetical protein